MSRLRPDERLVTVVLCDTDGDVLGALEPFLVRPQFWPEVDAVVAGVRERHGLEVVVLRLLTTSEPYAGGRVGYLAEVRSGPAARTRALDEPTAAALVSDPAYRMWWAEPGEVADLHEWVDDVLAANGRERTGPLRQRKTWNLSVVATAPTDRGPVWVKAVAPFLADEASVLRRVGRVDPHLGPVVLGHDPGRRLTVMEEVAGADQWEQRDPAVLESMVARWVAVQAGLAGDVDHLFALGAADLRRRALLSSVEDVARRSSVRDRLSREERGGVDGLVTTLPARLTEIEACGLPDTLVHGDLHVGNWRGDGTRLTLLDWGDVGVGNPVLDLRAFVERLPTEPLRRRLGDHWTRLWAEYAPGSRPQYAAELLAPVMQLAAAAAYQRFLDRIEVTERVYHVHDPVARLRAALAADRVGA